MTRPASNYRDRRRELERELADVPAPPPPPDLLDAIRREIPDDLVAPAEPAPDRRSAWWRAPVLRLAASIAFVAIGAMVVLRLTDRADRIPERLAKTAAGVSTETRPVARQAARPREVVQDIEKNVEEDSGKRKDEPASERREKESLRALGYVGGPSEGRGVAVESKALPESVAPVEVGASRGNEIESQLSGVPGGVQAAAPEKITVTSEAQLVDKYDTGRVAEETPPRDVSMRLSSADAAPAPPVTLSGGSPHQETIVVAKDRLARSGRVRTLEDVEPPAAGSTGGTAEPNEAPASDMFFRSTGVNPFVDTREDPLSTFALDVDTGSWTVARSYLDRGGLPPAEAIRVEEFVNAQKYDDPAPRRGEFTLVAEGAPSPFAPPGEYRLLRFAVKGREVTAGDRKPAVLTFVVDVSGSMNKENRIGLVKQALGLLLDELASDDRVGLVVYGTRGRVVLEHTSDHERIRRAIDSLVPEGSTNAEEGLRLGYDLAGQGYRSDWNNRVVLCSDGVANVGATGPESILERIGSEARRGIELTTVGFGMGNYNDALMEQLADQGDGSYHYVDTLEEARRIFVENLSGTIETIARDAKVQVELDPEAVERWRLLGYENRDVADRDFRNDRVDAGEIGAGHSATALYEIRLAPGARRNDTIGTLRLRWKSVATGNVEESALALRVRDLDASFTDASDNLRRAAVAAELAEILKHSYYAQEASWQTLRTEARRLEPEPEREAAGRRDALVEMVDRAGELSGGLDR